MSLQTYTLEELQAEIEKRKEPLPVPPSGKYLAPGAVCVLMEADGDIAPRLFRFVVPPGKYLRLSEEPVNDYDGRTIASCGLMHPLADRCGMRLSFVTVYSSLSDAQNAALDEINQTVEDLLEAAKRLGDLTEDQLSRVTL